MKISILNQQHPEYCGEEIEVRRALFEGGEKWRDELDDLLPQHEIETPTAYGRRKAHATYENHFGPLIGLMAGSLFAEPAKLTSDGDFGDYWTGLVKDCDGLGTQWSAWWCERMTEALWASRSWIWLDLPPARPAASVADQRATGAYDAYLRSIPPESVIDWGTDDAGLAWVRFRGRIRRAAGPLERATIEHRWTTVDRTEIRTFVWTPPVNEPNREPRDEDDAAEISVIQHGWGQIPVMMIELPRAVRAGELMRDPAIAHIRSRCELGWALFRAAVTILVITTRAGLGDDKIPKLGQGAYLHLENDGKVADKAEWLEPSGTSLAHLEVDVAERRAAIYRVVHQMAVALDPSASRTAQTAESKGMDWRAAEVVLSTLAGVALGAMRWAVEAIATLRSEDPPEVAGLDGWQNEETGLWLEQAALALEAKRSPTFVRLVAKEQARRLLPLATPEQLDDIAREIEDAVTAEAEVARPPPARLPALPGGRGVPAPGDGADGEPAAP